MGIGSSCSLDHFTSHQGEVKGASGKEDIQDGYDHLIRFLRVLVEESHPVTDRGGVFHIDPRVGSQKLEGQDQEGRSQTDA